jgi:hypothetical protein
MRSRELLSTLALLAVAGCGAGGGLKTKVVHGTVTVGGEKVDTGEVRFVPIDGTKGPTSVAAIVDGEYRIEARGGVPVGKHRVEVDARRKTGRQVEQNNGFETALVDETVRVGPAKYATDRSPLVQQVTSDSDDRIDIDIPAK